jgi:transcriptional regulator with XRE-family HTH domain
MDEFGHVLSALKRALKADGLTYRDVARELKVSEPSVKRWLTSRRIGVERLAKIAALASLTLAELCQRAAAEAPKVRQLTRAQEQELVSDTKLLLVTACAFNRWTPGEIVDAYQLTESECVQRLLWLDRLRLIDLLPHNRVRLNITQDFDWLPDGAIRKFFRAQWESDFLAGNFPDPGETLAFVHAMLTPAAIAKLQAILRRLRREVVALHEESLESPLAERHGTGVLLAAREWEPRSFAALRRIRAGKSTVRSHR